MPPAKAASMIGAHTIAEASLTARYGR